LRILISSEYFSIADPSLIRKMFSELGIDDVTIIVTLRRQDHFIESAYSQQVLMMGRTAAIDAPHYAKWYDWNLLVSSWACAFDRKIRVLAYERLVRKRKSVNREIVKLVDDAAIEIGNDMLDAKVNVSTPAKLLEFKRLANRLGNLEFNLFIERAIAADFDKTKFAMNSRKAKKYLAFYRRSNRKLAREFMGLNGDLFDEADLDRGGRALDYTDQLSISDLAGLVTIFMKENAGAPDAANGSREDKRIGELSALVKDQALQIVDADAAVRRVLREVEEREQRLIEADVSIRTLLAQVEDRDRRLLEADATIRRLLAQADERDRQVVEVLGAFQSHLGGRPSPSGQAPVAEIRRTSAV
jgi:hypothetical protein